MKNTRAGYRCFEPTAARTWRCAGLILGAVLIITSACSVSSAPAPPAATRAAVAQPEVEDTSALPEATTFASLAASPLDSTPGEETDGAVFHPTQETVVYNAPGGRPIARLPITQVGSPTWVPVVGRQANWRQVLLPSRPNAATGWVSTSKQRVDEARSPYRVHVDTARFLLTVSENGNQIGQWTVGTGKPQFPTPHGRTFLLASIEETKPTFSPIILPLGFHSESHETFGGGPGTVALHGWPDSSPFGKASSDGCVRVPGDALELLSTLPLGTIVTIQ